MPLLDDDLFLQAQQYDRNALDKLLTTLYAPICRMAYGLTGREDVGRGVVRFLMKQGLARLPQWRDGEAARRWFYHHTVLTTRRAALHQPTVKQEVLLHIDKPDAAYIAFIHALRSLPQQQREAFILHHGENLDLRQLAIAMDCSTHAADMHLRAAQQILEPLSGDAYPVIKDRMTQAYRQLTPPLDLIRPAIHRLVSRSLWPRRIKRILTLLLVLAILLAAYYFWHRFGHSFTWPQTQPH